MNSFTNRQTLKWQMRFRSYWRKMFFMKLDSFVDTKFFRKLSELSLGILCGRHMLITGNQRWANSQDRPGNSFVKASILPYQAVGIKATFTDELIYRRHLTDQHICLLYVICKTEELSVEIPFSPLFTRVHWKKPLLQISKFCIKFKALLTISNVFFDFGWMKNKYFSKKTSDMSGMKLGRWNSLRRARVPSLLQLLLWKDEIC